MGRYQVRKRYAGSILLEVKAVNEAQAEKLAEKIIQSMDSVTFLEALELQHLDTEVIPLKDEFILSVDERHLATILAALRFHQDENLRAGTEIPDCKINDIATDCGTLKPLNFDEVNKLCERINISYKMPGSRNEKN
jgi:hypothetical protein